MGNACGAEQLDNWHTCTRRLWWRLTFFAGRIQFHNFMKAHQTIAAILTLLCGASLGHTAPASENWDNNCTKCHGDDGKGQTKAGRKLQLKDYTDAKVQADMTDEEMTKVITEGVKDKAGKEKMKAYQSELTADEIKDLVAYVRKFKG